MPLEMLLFLEKSRIPDRTSLQNMVDSLGLPFSSTRDLTLSVTMGFHHPQSREMRPALRFILNRAKKCCLSTRH
jgi:hypothetical protein